MKKIKIQSLIAPLLAVTIAMILIISDRYTGDEYKNKLRQKYVYPFIKEELNGVVTKVYRTDLDNFSRGEFFRRSVQVNYREIDTGIQSNFDTQLSYESYISIGDTVSKQAGEDFFYVKKGNGNVRKFSIL